LEEMGNRSAYGVWRTAFSVPGGVGVSRRFPESD